MRVTLALVGAALLAAAARPADPPPKRVTGVLYPGPAVIARPKTPTIEASLAFHLESTGDIGGEKFAAFSDDDLGSLMRGFVEGDTREPAVPLRVWLKVAEPEKVTLETLRKTVKRLTAAAPAGREVLLYVH